MTEDTDYDVICSVSVGKMTFQNISFGKNILTLHDESFFGLQRRRRDEIRGLASVHSLVVVRLNSEDKFVDRLVAPARVREVNLSIVFVPVHLRQRVATLGGAHKFEGVAGLHSAFCVAGDLRGSRWIYNNNNNSNNIVII